MENDGREEAHEHASSELVAKHGEHWGLGGRYDEQQNNRLIRQSLRWKTNARSRCLTKDMKAKEIAVQVTRANMLAENAVVSNGAVANLIRMEAQNQADEHAATPKIAATLNVDATRAAGLAVLERLRAAGGHEAVAGGGPAVLGNGHAGGPGSGGEPRRVETSEAPPAHQPGSNGSHKRNGSAGADR